MFEKLLSFLFELKRDIKWNENMLLNNLILNICFYWSDA